MLFVENISGLGQNEMTWNGVQELHEKILSHLDDYSPLAVRVRYRRYNENWKAVALNYQHLRLMYPKERFVIVVNCYSYGVGHGLVSLAWQLNRYGFKIQVANICDGVYHHWHPLGWWRAMVSGYNFGKEEKGWRIKLPPNVLSYYGFYQRSSTGLLDRILRRNPSGLKPIGPATCLGWEEIKTEHIWMDDCEEWHEQCIKTVKDEVRIAVPSKSFIPIGAPQTPETESRLSNK